jgi:hypothetical protein
MEHVYNLVELGSLASLAGWLVIRPGRTPALVLGIVLLGYGLLVGYALGAWGWLIVRSGDLAPEVRTLIDGPRVLGPYLAWSLFALVLLVRGWRRFRREEAERAQAGRVAAF